MQVFKYIHVRLTLDAYNTRVEQPFILRVVYLYRCNDIVNTHSSRSLQPQHAIKRHDWINSTESCWLLATWATVTIGDKAEKNLMQTNIDFYMSAKQKT